MKKTVLMLSLCVGATGFAADELVGAGKMVNCPSAVEGSKTEVNELKDKLEITVTGGDEAEIRKRAKHLAKASKENPAAVKHSGSGQGGGGLGQCPVVLKDTVITAKDVPGGATLTVKPTKSVDFEWLKRETKQRQASFAQSPSAK